MTKNEGSKKTFFYGWLIVFACIIVQAVPYTIAANIQPAFTNYVVEGEGFSFTQFSLIFTIGTVISAICAPFIGKIYSKPNVNVKLFYIIGILLVGCGFAAFSLAGDNIFMYYALSIVVQIGCCIISAIGVPTLINSWFKVNKGVAMGAAFCGGGFGNMIFQLVAGGWLADPSIGYKDTYFRLGMIALAITLPIAILLVRYPKSQAELDANVPKKGKEEDATPSDWGYTFAEASKMKEYWIMAGSFIFVGLYVGGMAIQFLPYLQGLEAEGSFLMASATVASLMGFVSIFGNLLGGMLFDKLGITKSLLLAACLVIISGLCLILAPQVNALAYVFAVCLGVSVYAYIIGPSYLTGSLFGNKEFGTILGVTQIFFAVGFGSGTTLFGVIIDKFSFTTGWMCTIAYAVIAYTGLLYATTSLAKKNKALQSVETKNA